MEAVHWTYHDANFKVKTVENRGILTHHRLPASIKTVGHLWLKGAPLLTPPTES